MNKQQKETPLLKTNPTQPRVGIIVDTTNLYFSARQQLGGKLNYEHIYKLATDGRVVDRAICYLTENGNSACTGFIRSLGELGFETKLKRISYRDNGAVRGTWDVGMTIDATDMMDEIDVLVLVSGNGNLVDLAEYARYECNVDVEIMGVEDTISTRLIEIASKVSILDKAHLINGTL